MSKVPLQVRIVAALIGALILFCVVKVAGWLLGATTAGLVRTAILLAVLLGFAGYVCWRGTRTSTSHRTHVHGDNYATAARHEAGHAAMYRAIGATGIRGRINANGSGWVQAQVSTYMYAEEMVAVGLAGGLREGVNPWTSPHCAADMANVRADLRGVRRSEHGRVIAKATSMARSQIHSGYAASVERRLLRNGRI